MNFLVRAPIGPNNVYQWIPCDDLRKAIQVARIVSHGEAPIIYALHDGKKVEVSYE